MVIDTVRMPRVNKTNGGNGSDLMPLFPKLMDVGLSLFVGFRVIYHQSIPPQSSIHEGVRVDVE